MPLTPSAERVLPALIHSNPNGFRTDRVPDGIQDLNQNDVAESARELEALGIARLQHQVNRVVGHEYDVITLSNPGEYPIRRTIPVAGREFPRMLSGDIVGGEDLNLTVLVLAEIEDASRHRLEALSAEMTRRYWVNAAAVGAILISVFALILRASEPLMIGNRGPKDVLLLKAAEVFPLAVVLAVFVGLLRFSRGADELGHGEDVGLGSWSR